MRALIAPRVVATTALALVAALAGVVLTAPASQATGERYVALGDSFTSGPGISPQKPEGCMRSARNFPSLLAARLGTDAFTDASCGGAETKDLTGTQNGAEGPQLNALTADTTLVTFGTIGGNDIGLVQLATSCFTADCVPSGPDPYAAKFEALGVALDAGIDEAQTRAPNARIVVVGYGTYLPPDGCVDAFGGALTVEEFDYVQAQIDRLSDLLQTVATGQGVDFVDMREIPGTLAHTACAAPEKQWIRALQTYDDGAPLHPSACGMDAMAQHLHREILRFQGEPVLPTFDDSCVSAGGASPTTPTTGRAPQAPPVASIDTAGVVRRSLLAQAATLRLEARCATGATGRRVVLRVRGRAADAGFARFGVGSRRLGADRDAPLRVVRPVGPRGWSGAVVAKVRLERSGVQLWHRLERPRPRCLR